MTDGNEKHILPVMRVVVALDCVPEMVNRAKFQAEGHFATSNCTAEEICNLTLMTPKTSDLPGADSQTQILRVQANTVAEAGARMAIVATEHFWAMAKREKLSEMNWDAYLSTNRRIGNLVDYMTFHKLTITGEDPVETAIHLLADLMIRRHEETAPWWHRWFGLGSGGEA